MTLVIVSSGQSSAFNGRIASVCGCRSQLEVLVVEAEIRQRRDGAHGDAIDRAFRGERERDIRRLDQGIAPVDPEGVVLPVRQLTEHARCLLEVEREPAVGMRDRDRPVPNVGEIARVPSERQRRTDLGGAARFRLQFRERALPSLAQNLTPRRAPVEVRLIQVVIEKLPRHAERSFAVLGIDHRRERRPCGPGPE